MANKETYRTINNLWLFNFCAVTVIVTLHLRYAFANETKVEVLHNTTTLENNSTSQQPIAEALIRFRRQPPRTIVKHIIRPKRYKMKRVKRPKIKYSFAEPPTTYYIRKPAIMKKPTFDSSIFEDFSHMNVEAADFDLPPSSYEAQSMDLDLYKHYEPSIEAASYREIQKPPLYKYAEHEISYKEEPSYTEELKRPSYTYSAPEISYKEISKPSVTYSYTSEKGRKPHTQYGVPTEFHYSTGYDKPRGDNKYTFDAPVNKPMYTEIEKPFYNAPAKTEYTYKKPSSKDVPRIPATTYGVPDVHIPVTGSNDYNKYSVVEQKPTYGNHAPTKTDIYHFAEPPEPKSNVEITYSPSYEINIPSAHENSYSGGKYKAENHAPIEYPPHTQHPPSGYDETNHQQHPKYEESPQHYSPPAHYRPTNNHENPSQENYEDSATSHQEVSGTNQPASYHPAPPRHHTIDEYIPPSKDLPIDVNHKQPAYDYPKSSYEVPIYDPIPFDASSQQETEIYPPHTFAQSNNKPTDERQAQGQSLPSDGHSPATQPQNPATRPQSPINHLRRTRKRKRTKGSSTTVSTTKHILDVPELEEAFAKENRNKYANSQEPDANESQRFEKFNSQNNINDNNYSKGSWNPMKIRTSPIMLVTTASTIPPIKTSATKNKRYHYKQYRTHNPSTTTTTASNKTMTTEAPTRVDIISIEKSKSKSYYDGGGVVSTPKIYNTNFFRNRFRLENLNPSTTPQTHMKSTDEINFSKRTTKNIFDTTIFKSPFTDSDDVHHNLPKNHKLF